MRYQRWTCWLDAFSSPSSLSILFVRRGCNANANPFGLKEERPLETASGRSLLVVEVYCTLKLNPLLVPPEALTVMVAVCLGAFLGTTTCMVMVVGLTTTMLLTLIRVP